jgi:hypothetical protein
MKNIISPIYKNYSHDFDTHSKSIHFWLQSTELSTWILSIPIQFLFGNSLWREINENKNEEWKKNRWSKNCRKKKHKHDCANGENGIQKRSLNKNEMFMKH